MHPVVGGEKKKVTSSWISIGFKNQENLGESAGENNVEEQVCFHAGVYAGTSGAQGWSASRLCSASPFFFFFLLSFTQLKRIKVCFFFFLLPPNIITGYEMSHSGVWETQQWRRKNLFIRLWLPEHCPVETGRETNTHTHKHTQRDTCRYIQKKKTSKFISSFFHLNTDVFIPVSVTLSKKARLDFFSFLCTVKLCLLLGGGKCLNAKALVLLWQSGRLTPPLPPSWTPSFLW